MKTSFKDIVFWIVTGLFLAGIYGCNKTDHPQPAIANPPLSLQLASPDPKEKQAKPGKAPESKPLYKITEKEAYDLAHDKIAEKMGKEPPRRPKWKHWSSTLSYGFTGGNEQRLIWTIGADFAPAGGGTHASVRIDAVTGEVLQVYIGKHLR